LTVHGGGFIFPGEFLVPPKPPALSISAGTNKTELAEVAAIKEGWNGEQDGDMVAIKPDPYEFLTPAPVSPETKNERAPGSKKRKPSFPRKQFRETVGSQIYKDLMSEQFSYDEIIAKYSTMYPEYASKFTPSFCSKVRCGRIMNPEATKVKGVTKPKSRVKRVSKLSHRKTWRKMTPELFAEISEWEKGQNRAVKQVEFEQIFNVNRSTYYRWKKSQSKSSSAQNKTFGN